MKNGYALRLVALIILCMPFSCSICFDPYYDEDEAIQEEIVTDDDSDPGDDDNDDNVDPSDQEVWEDSATGLMWQKTDECCRNAWQALSHCDYLSWAGYSDWRLPTISELRSLIRGCSDTETGGDCGVVDECIEYSCWNNLCGGCTSEAGPGPGGQYIVNELEGEGDKYWSISEASLNAYYYTYHYWYVNFDFGRVDYYWANYEYYVRCVR